MQSCASLAPLSLADRHSAGCGRGVGCHGASTSGRLSSATDLLHHRWPAATRGAPFSRAHLRVDAFAQGLAGSQQGSSDDDTYERVLRYPTGEVRRIRYPLPPVVEPAAEDLTDGCWANTCWEPRECWLYGSSSGGGGGGAAGAVASSKKAAAAAPLPGTFLPQQPAEPERPSLPSSPMELLRYLNSPEYKQSQQEQWRKVRGSYEVLDGCPWVEHRPLYLLAVQQPAAAFRDAPPGLTYTLRTRVARADTEDELSVVLRRRAADGSPLISCSEMRDGVVAFEDEADAERYGQLLEAEGTSVAEVSIARCDSHELFRSVQDVRGVLVLVRRGGTFLPQPHQLATALRNKTDTNDQPLFD